MSVAEEKEGVRLNKYLSEAGVCSRREADRLIEAGEVLIDGIRAVPGIRVLPGQEVICQGSLVAGKPEEVLLAFHKPRGIICTTADPKAPNTIFATYAQPVSSSSSSAICPRIYGTSIPLIQ